MKIGISTLFLIPNQVGGTEFYFKNLIKSISYLPESREHEFVLFTSEANDYLFHDLPEHFSRVKVTALNPNSRIKRIFWEQSILPLQVLKRNIDLMFFPANVSALFLPCPSVITVHDLQYKSYPEYFSWSKRIYFEIFLRFSLQTSKSIISISDYTANEITKYYSVSRSKIFTTYLAADNRFNRDIEVPDGFTKKYGIDSPYILSVASLHPHKNLINLIRAYAMIKVRTNHKLVLVGMRGTAFKKLVKMIQSYQLEKDIILTGYVPDEEVPYFYQLADLYVMPSMFEGFGIPLLESMKMSVPVAASNVTSIPEIGGPACAYFQPDDPHSIANIMLKVLFDASFKAELVHNANEWVKKFDYSKTAHKTLEILIQAK
jgi:glycosyltransferase involved in cell wall biosynthesis